MTDTNRPISTDLAVYLALQEAFEWMGLQELTDAVEVGYHTTSQHARRLYRAELLERRRVGKCVEYRLREEP